EEITRKFDDIVAFSEVEKFIDTPVKRYSSGMYVRLAFAVAAHLEPEILIVDEVLAVGDMAFQAKCLGKMVEVGRKGSSELFVCNNMQSVSQLTEQTFLLSGGRVVFRGRTEDGIARYLADESRDKSIGNQYQASVDKSGVYLQSARVISSHSAGEHAHGRPLT